MFKGNTIFVTEQCLFCCLTCGHCADDLLKTVKEEILSPGLSLDLVEDERKVLREVTQGDVTEGVTGRRLDLF